MEDDDDTLVARYRKGEDEAFTLLLERYLRMVYNFCYRFTRTSAEAEDVAQETFVKVWRYIDRYTIGKNFKAWLLTIARNTTLDHLRKRKEIVLSQFDHEGSNSVLDTLASTDPTPIEASLRHESAEAIERALQEVPVLYREVLVLRFQEDLTFEEISTVVKKPLNTVKSQYRRGIALLRSKLQL